MYKNIMSMTHFVGSRGIVPLTLKFSPRWRQMVYFIPWSLEPWERTQIPIELEAGWFPEAVWTFWISLPLPGYVGCMHFVFDVFYDFSHTVSSL
jgi:hypothetical protein